jgi:hypothetical protein
LLDEGGQIVPGGRQEAFSQAHFARETIAPAPQDFMADIRLETIESQDDPPVKLGEALEALVVLERKREEFVVAIQEIGDGTLGHGHPTVNQGVMEFGDTAVVAIALGANTRDNIKAELVLG